MSELVDSSGKKMNGGAAQSGPKRAAAPIRLFVASPSAHPHPEYITSMDLLRDVFRQKGWAMGVYRETGDGVVRARNRAIALMRAHPFAPTHFACIDDDLGFNPQDIVTMIEATLAGLDVVGGVYPKKIIDWHAVAAAVKAGVPPEKLRDIASPLCCNFEATEAEIEDIAKGPKRGEARLGAEVCNDGRGHHFVAIKDLPTGFMVMKFDVIERIIAHYGESIAFTPPPDAYGTHMASNLENEFGAKRWYKIFHMDTWENNPESDYISEDWWFCRQWQKMGGKVWAFAECRLMHYGAHAFSGCAADQLVLGEVDRNRDDHKEDAQDSQTAAQ